MRASNPDILSQSEEKERQFVLQDLNERTSWFIKLRWAVPPFICLGVFLVWFVGFAFEYAKIIAIAFFILAYNFLFLSILKTKKNEHLTHLQVGFDYAAMFLLVHFSGGLTSPLVFFFIFHIVIASILLPARSAYFFAALAIIGVSFIAVAEQAGFISRHSPVMNQLTNKFGYQPFYEIIFLLCFSASALFTAFLATGLMSILQKRVVAIARASAEIQVQSDKLNTLYTMVEAVGSTPRLHQVLDVAKEELVKTMGVRAISVKLLSENGQLLHYAASYGLPADLVKKKSVEVALSPLNKKILEGESFVTGQISEKDRFQFSEDLAQAGFQSVLFVPLKVEQKVIGILGAYCSKSDKFADKDVEFFSLSAGLLAIAIENARAYEAIASLSDERSRFMLRVAHNLRAPLAATIGMVEVLRGDYLGSLNASQAEYLRRVDRRAKTMASMINELMALARSRTEKHRLERAPVNMELLVGRVQRTFQNQADKKGIKLEINQPKDLPKIVGDAPMLEQMLENLVSNAIKYTPQGSVCVSLSRGKDDEFIIEVKDTGIGIPPRELPELFVEFFRATNARTMDDIGTGLGLAMVKETVDQHRGKIDVFSEVGRGTTFIVHLPAKPKGLNP